MSDVDWGDWYLEVNGRKVGPFTLDQVQGFLDDGEIRAYHQVTSKDLQGRWISVEELLESHQDELRTLAEAPPLPPKDFPEITLVSPTPSRNAAPAPVAAAPVAASPAAAAPEHEPSHPHYTPYTPAPDAPSIAELAATYSPDASFQPPPRPEIETEPLSSETGERAGDPTMSLFDALQVVRERQAASFHPPAVKIPTSRKPLFKMPTAENVEKVTREVTKKITRIKQSIPLPDKVPPRLWAIAIAAGIVLGALTMGVFKLMKPKLHPTPGSLTQVNSLNPQNKPIEPPKHILPPVAVPRGLPVPIHPPEPGNPPPAQEQHANENNGDVYKERDPNNPYPEDNPQQNQPANGGAVPNPQGFNPQGVVPPQGFPPGQEPQQLDPYGNPVQQPPFQPPQPQGVDAYGNPLPQGGVNDTGQVPQPGQPGAPGQDAFPPNQ